jgi:poly-gamma-glutamate synthesis protein (capsule biosynthesis protein)
MRRALASRLLLIVVTGAAAGAVAFVVLTPPPAPPAVALPLDPTTTTAMATTTTTRAATTSTTLPPRGWLVIHGVGDVNFDPAYVTTFRSEGYDVAFAGLGDLFREDDLTVVNLECTPSERGSPLPKEFTFRCDPAALPVAAAAGVEVVNLANNHGQDFGPEAMLDGRANVADAGLLPVGVGADLAEATAPAIVEVNGWKVAVLGFGGVVPNDGWLATADRPGMAGGDDTDLMVSAVRSAAAEADLVVVTIHWGRELETEPREDDRARAEALIAAGADVIFGHHPHRLGALEEVQGRPVAWTLGNFIWPRLSDAGATTAVARVVVSPSGDIEACLIPAFIERSGQPVLRGEAGCAPGRTR